MSADTTIVATFRLPIPVTKLAALNKLCKSLYGPDLRISGDGEWVHIHRAGAAEAES